MTSPSSSPPAQEDRRPPASALQPDYLRASYNLATAYTNYAYLNDPPRLTEVRNRDEALARADELCRTILSTVRPGQQSGKDEQQTETEPQEDHQGRQPTEKDQAIPPALKEKFLVPTVTLLAGIRALRHRHHDAPYASPKWLFLTAMDKSNPDAALHSLMTKEAAGGDALLLWLEINQLNLTPRAAYNLACYRVAMGEFDQALTDLAMATGDTNIRKWAVLDPALYWLRMRQQQKFNELFPPDVLGKQSHERPQESEASPAVRKVEPNWKSRTLIADTQTELSQLKRKLGPDAHTVVWAARRMIQLWDSTSVARLDAWATGDEHQTSLHFQLTASERLWSTFEAQVNVEGGESVVCEFAQPPNFRIDVPRFLYRCDRKLPTPWDHNRKCSIEISEKDGTGQRNHVAAEFSLT